MVKGKGKRGPSSPWMRIHMTSYFLDVNVWLALSDSEHSHHSDAWRWLGSIANGDRLMFSRQTQIGLLRLLTSSAAMRAAVLTLGEAWKVYDEWLDDPRVQFHPEPHGTDLAFREVTAPSQSCLVQRPWAIVTCWHPRVRLERPW
ncbi:MAG: hypothetical protein WDO18_22795 [Acidobacteriota bacterium]